MSQAFDDLVAVVTRLRGPNGCPWDKKQTHESLKPYLIEEAYEVLDALDRNDPRQLREELGDLLLQVLLHAELEAEQHRFTIHDVIAALDEKLTRRHPHVFGTPDETASSLNAEQVIHQWEKIKQSERSFNGQDDSMLAGVPASLPALLRAYHIQKRASRVGFDWHKPEQVIEKLEEELEELREATSRHQPLETAAAQKETTPSSFEAVEEEFGDVLFTIANLARFLKINPEEALRKSCNRFARRFAWMEQQAIQAGKALQHLTPADWDALWEEAKKHEQDALDRPSSSSPRSGSNE